MLEDTVWRAGGGGIGLTSHPRGQVDEGAGWAKDGRGRVGRCGSKTMSLPLNGGAGCLRLRDTDVPGRFLPISSSALFGVLPFLVVPSTAAFFPPLPASVSILSSSAAARQRSSRVEPEWVSALAPLSCPSEDEEGVVEDEEVPAPVVAAAAAAAATAAEVGMVCGGGLLLRLWGCSNVKMLGARGIGREA